MIIGTAGHIDHGKTALTRALTGKPSWTPIASGAGFLANLVRLTIA